MHVRGGRSEVALMDTREAALAEPQQVFALIAQRHQDRGKAVPAKNVLRADAIELAGSER
jgi:hypothetical protein